MPHGAPSGAPPGRSPARRARVLRKLRPPPGAHERPGGLEIAGPPPRFAESRHFLWGSDGSVAAHPMSTWHNFRAAVADEWVTGTVHYRVQLGRITRGAVAVGVASARAPSTTRITGSPAASSRPSRWCPGRVIFRRGYTDGSTATKIVQRGLGVSCVNGVHLLPHKPWRELKKADVVDVVIHLRDVQFFHNCHLRTPAKPVDGAAAGVCRADLRERRGAYRPLVAGAGARDPGRAAIGGLAASCAAGKLWRADRFEPVPAQTAARKVRH